MLPSTLEDSHSFVWLFMWMIQVWGLISFYKNSQTCARPLYAYTLQFGKLASFVCSLSHPCLNKILKQASTKWDTFSAPFVYFLLGWARRKFCGTLGRWDSSQPFYIPHISNYCLFSDSPCWCNGPSGPQPLHQCIQLLDQICSLFLFFYFKHNF